MTFLGCQACGKPPYKNIYVDCISIIRDFQIKRKGLQFNYDKFGSSLYLPSSVFENGQDHRVVSLVYKTLNAVMRLQNETNGTQIDSDVLTANTTIVTSIVSPPPPETLRGKKVKIVMQNKRVSVFLH